MNNKERLKSAFESMMFVFGEPIDAKIAAAATGIDKAEAVSLFRELACEYEEEGRGIRVRETGGRFGFVTYEENYDYIRAITTPAKERRLSQAALEALAIVAYKQPVTKSEIDRIRGIKSDRVVEGLAEKELIEERGRSEAIGRPVFYGTTGKFLEYFDLKDLGELPVLDDESLEEAIRDFSSYGADQENNGEAWGQTKLELSEN
ncbi:MAG: SMC-Scp complex subunit ScpB [Clostridiales Family XIII bacterium]|jgi:segregation and condensation protein B|nr:SMC-Scp complex subunit ScpB [Clostridiales Family XIII bacterium]